MARKDNRIAVKTVKITLPWPLFEYIDRAIQSGFYRATYTAAAEAMVEEHIKQLLREGKIAELTPEELKKSPSPKK